MAHRASQFMSTDQRSVDASEFARERPLLWILRVGAGGCFVGHGAFGVITKAGWLPYFAVGGIHGATAWQLMPLIGAMDIAIGLSLLMVPWRPILVWAVAWATWTALCRPLAGESMWEFVERAGNYGVPLALLAAMSVRGDGGARLRWILRGTTAAILIGHAGCVLTEPHASFCHNYAVLWPHAPAAGMFVFALLELALAFAVLIRPSFALLLGIALWKIGTESLFLFAHAPVWEVVERFGSYTAPLALAWLMSRRPAAESLSIELSSTV